MHIVFIFDPTRFLIDLFYFSRNRHLATFVEFFASPANDESIQKMKQLMKDYQPPSCEFEFLRLLTSGVFHMEFMNVTYPLRLENGVKIHEIKNMHLHGIVHFRFSFSILGSSQ